MEFHIEYFKNLGMKVAFKMVFEKERRNFCRVIFITIRMFVNDKNELE